MKNVMVGIVAGFILGLAVLSVRAMWAGADGKGPVVKPPNGSCWELVFSDAGEPGGLSVEYPEG